MQIPRSITNILLVAAAGFRVLYASSVYDGLLDVQFHDCAPGAQAGVGPLMASCSSINGMGEGLANYTSMGVSGTVNPASAWGGNADMYDTLTVGGVSLGTQIDLTFLLGYSGTYSFSSLGPPPGAGSVNTTVLFAFDNPTNYIVDDMYRVGICAPDVVGLSCDAYGKTYQGSTDRFITSTTVTVMAGAAIPVHLEFSLFLQASSDAALSADFLDPLTLMNILVTDPNTGLPISGATVTGGSGTIYPANASPSSVPEPSFLGALGIALVSIRCALGRPRRTHGTLNA